MSLLFCCVEITLLNLTEFNPIIYIGLCQCAAVIRADTSRDGKTAEYKGKHSLILASLTIKSICFPMFIIYIVFHFFIRIFYSENL